MRIFFFFYLKFKIFLNYNETFAFLLGFKYHFTYKIFLKLYIIYLITEIFTCVFFNISFIFMARCFFFGSVTPRRPDVSLSPLLFWSKARRGWNIMNAILNRRRRVVKGKKGKKVEEMEDSLVHVDELMTQLLHCSIVNDEHTSTSVGCSSSSGGGGSSSGSRKTGEMSELDEVEKAIEAQQKWNKHVASNRKLEGLEEEVPIFLEWSKYVRRCCFFFL